ncbi:MAG: hypothetical protein Q9O62_12530 [Ardenticatenia bacterium]|nr:hypothetical protein [Ardenticatenia bacterium]
MRALLAYVLPYRRATVLAVRVGQAVAVCSGAWPSCGPLLAAIAFFCVCASRFRRWDSARGVAQDTWERSAWSDFMRQRGSFRLGRPPCLSSALAAAVVCAQHVWPVVERGKARGGIITPKRLPAGADLSPREGRDGPGSIRVLAPHMTLYEATFTSSTRDGRRPRS